MKFIGKYQNRYFGVFVGIVQFGIHYSSWGTPFLVGFTNSNWFGNHYDQKSIVGYVPNLGFGPLTCACKKQQAIFFSSIEVEYHVTVNAFQESLWIWYILSYYW
jgi:hypothetical protein